MAVLVEGISVIIKRSVIEEKFPGGWEAFVEDVPNRTLCADDELARVGFMAPLDAEEYVQHLINNGFEYLSEGMAVDLVVADQLRGLATECDWCEFGQTSGGGNNLDRIAGCRAVGSRVTTLVCPEGWHYEGSLSQKYAFVPSADMEKSMKFLRHEKGLDVYLNQLTGKEVFIGRTGAP
jgi:hypothetical protein